MRKHSVPLLLALGLAPIPALSDGATPTAPGTTEHTEVLSYEVIKSFKPEISISGKDVKVKLRMAKACSSLLLVDDPVSVKDATAVTVTKETTKDDLEAARAVYGLTVSFVSAEYESLNKCIKAHKNDDKDEEYIKSSAEINAKEPAKVGFLAADGKSIEEDKSVVNKSSLEDLARKLADLKDITCEGGGNCYTSDVTRSDTITKLTNTITSINALIKKTGLDGEVDMDPAELQKMLDAVLTAADGANDFGAIAKASKSLKEFSLKLVAIKKSKKAKDFDEVEAGAKLDKAQEALFLKAKALSASSEESANDIVGLMSEIRSNQSKNPVLSSEDQAKISKEARALRERGSDERLSIFKEKMPAHSEIREDRNMRINNYNMLVRPTLVNNYVNSLNNYASRGCPVLQDQGTNGQLQGQGVGMQQRRTAHALPNVTAIQTSGNMYCATLAQPLTNAYWALKNGDNAVDAAMALAMADLTGAQTGGQNSGAITGATSGSSNIAAVKVPQYEPVQNQALLNAIAAFNNSGNSGGIAPQAGTVQTPATNSTQTSFFNGNGLSNQFSTQAVGVPFVGPVS